jgi:NitT/TauT family transport system permease protein
MKSPRERTDSGVVIAPPGAIRALTAEGLGRPEKKAWWKPLRAKYVSVTNRNVVSYLRKYGPAILLFVLLAVGWELSPILTGIPQYIIPNLSSTLVEMVSQWGIIVQNLYTTLYETLAGFALGVLSGLALSLAIFYIKPLKEALYPLIIALQVVPKIAVAPILVALFGFGLLPKIIVATLIAFFPVVINVTLGLEGLSREYMELARSTGASEGKIFTKIRLPYAMPYVFAGLKLAVTFAVVGAVAGEWVGSNSGLGYLIQYATGFLEMQLVFATFLVLTGFGVVLFLTVELAERYFLRWHRAKTVMITV